MDNPIILEQKLHSFTEEELTQYIYTNADCLTIMSFNALKKEIAVRKDLSNEVKMLIKNIENLINQNFINEIFPYLYYKNKKIKTVEDLITDLKKNGIHEPNIHSLLRQLPQIIEINTSQSNPKNSIQIFGILFSIVISIISFNLFETSGIIICLISALTIVYLIFNINNYSRINKLKINIEFYLDSLESINKIKPR
jgi:hypothetical protein